MASFKLLTLLGIRPDLIRMAKLIRLLDAGQKKHNYKHIFVHSGQHFDYELDDVFYKDLNIRKPDTNLGIGKTLKTKGKTGHAYQTALLCDRTYKLFQRIKPNAVLYLGDTNTVTSSIVAAKQNIPIIHIEGGGRSFDWRMPEEKNRIMIDHLSDMLYVYLERYKRILLREGVPSYRIKVVGNIIVDAIYKFLPLVQKSKIRDELRIKNIPYVLLTLHREENIMDDEIFIKKVKDVVKLSKHFPIVFPVLPRVKARIKKCGLGSILDDSCVIRTRPLGFLDFLNLENYAYMIITDSGTVQEEALILGVPCLVSRLSTERPETIKVGAAILDDDNLYRNALKVMNLARNWDRKVLNPSGGSPSEKIYNDLITKIASNYFRKSRSFRAIHKDLLVREAYGFV